MSVPEPERSRSRRLTSSRRVRDRPFTWIATFEKHTVPPTLLILVAMAIAASTTLPVDWNYAGMGAEGIAR
jgi:hypothetical protein